MGRVPLQLLMHSIPEVSSGHVYNFHNCNVVINQDMPDRLTLHTRQAVTYNVSATMLLASSEGF